MYATPMPYEELADGGYFMTRVRAFGPWAVWSASRDADFLLLLVNEDSHEAVRCEYEDRKECFADIKLLRNIPCGRTIERDCIAA